jgi:hypothetical protein
MATARPEVQQIGESQRLFAEQVKAKYEELMLTGQCEPFTVVSFNPVEVGLQGILKQFKVPTPDDERLPKNVLRVTLPYDGYDRVGSVLTLREPKMYGKMVGAASGGAPGEVIPQQEVQYYLPSAIAYSFLEHFSPIFMAPAGTIQPPAPKDARKLYGLLVFKGDIHTLERLLDEDDTSKQIIEVPIAHVTIIGKSSHKTYRTVRFNLQDYITRMFEGQKKFADATISRAQQKWSEEQGIRDISDSDRTWYRWAIAHGYAPKPKPGEKTWLNELLVMTGAAETQIDSRLRKCPGCRTREPEADTPFCPKCNMPMDTFKTYMAGHHVADSYLMTLRGEEREIALAERKIRLQGFEHQGTVTREQGSAEGEAPATVAAAGARGEYKKPRGSAKAAAIDPTQEIPATTTTIPGEE